MVRARTVPRLLALAALTGACAHDWSVRADADAGATPIDDGGPVPIEAGPSDAGIDAAVDANPGDGATSPDCTALAIDLGAKRKAARACQLGQGQCLSTLKDQCDCDVVIAVPGSSSAIAYASAVTGFKASGCPKGCASQCAATTPRNCLQQGADVTCVP